MRSSWKWWCCVLFPPFALLLTTSLISLVPFPSFRPEAEDPPRILSLHPSSSSSSSISHGPNYTTTTTRSGNTISSSSSSSQETAITDALISPYHNWQLFNSEYLDMSRKLKIYVYPDVFAADNDSFASIFLPHPNPMDRKIGNYFSEHAFKLALLNSSLLARRPQEAHLFFMPFSINAMRNHPLLRSEASSIPNFVANYVSKVSSQFKFWNASGGADHFFVCCHSVGSLAASRHFALHNNAIQVTCSSSYFQRLYTPHKDIALPQIWPRKDDLVLNPPSARNKLAFFAGRVQNSHVRKELVALWGNDTSFSIFSGHSSFPYEEGFRRSKYCLHVKGYEVNTARVSDAIHYGCVPVLISNHYDLPFANVLDWSKFSIIVSHTDIARLKHILTSVSEQMYMNLYNNLCIVRKHFRWHTVPKSYDAFHMTAYQLWLRRGTNQLAT